MKANLCQRCGEPLAKENGLWACRCCGATYSEEDAASAIETMKKILEDAKIELLSNRRRVLWEAAHKLHISTKEIRRAAADVREVYEEDRLARFYQCAVSDNAGELNEYLLKEQGDIYDAREIVRFCLLSLDLRNVLSLRNYVEKHFSGKEKLSLLQQIADETEKLDQGVYLTSLPRHVFIAYSSADMDEVIRTADYLEEQGISCFVASRNLRHGKGSVENYEKALYDALSHCACLVFISSEHSRSLSCDALTVELPFAFDNLPKQKRIQYVIEEPGKKTGPAVKTLLKTYFQGEEWITDLETLSEKIALSLVRKDKVCFHCHSINSSEATHCHQCGYPLDRSAYDKRVEEEKKQQEALAKLAELEKKQSEKPLACPNCLTAVDATWTTDGKGSYRCPKCHRLTYFGSRVKIQCALETPKKEKAEPAPKAEPKKPVEKPAETKKNTTKPLAIPKTTAKPSPTYSANSEKKDNESAGTDFFKKWSNKFGL